MGRKNKYPAEIKEQAINEYLNGIKGAPEIAEELSIDSSTLRSWVKKYQTYGIEVFSDKDRNKSYSKELKESAIRDYLEGAGSLKDISIKYGISSHEVLRGWIKKYNRLETIKDYDPKGEVYMTKGRKTTIEERQEIVAYCIEHDYDYKGTAERYELSYAQVYQWVKKYNELGDDGLLDKRGKRKQEDQLSNEERLERKVKLLERQLELKERENILLKKVKEIERGRYSPKQNKK
ncbi:helix-turn-helix domain-containing protein [Erysipelothrix amsterdamensis]|uniref:Helix-turn-helix domain-containing protein n=1 Tax=Erysipelothrix amsterdamensis TaxID=2929157 RepID=A0AAU9VDM3_9FIRM|nr:transposase [Erysipelothrix sp. A18Y020d]CAH2760466.1 transposase [Erysipelothrix sp. A18Y020d]CAH2760520.1 transposase [Erysipelothrix sp. A18Y020d]CAH2760574.1 transposase [Erysipelothrix sp. A18Y020d]CAH2760636.1 transposase [Erysipelothrix sp. A18Y020d]